MANQESLSQADRSMNSGKKKGSSKSLFSIILGIVFVIVLAIVVFLLLSSKEKNNLIVTEENIDTIQEELNKKVAEGMYEVKMNTDWEFQTSTEPSTNAYIANPTTNRYTVYFEVIIDQTKEVVFTSPYIPVGSKLQNLTLDSKELSAGTYPATAIYHLVDQEYEEVSDLSIAVTLTILK